MTIAIVCCMVGLSACSSTQGIVKKEEPFKSPNSRSEQPTPPVGSLWPGERSTNMLFSDSKARYVGDIITIVVDETSSGQNQAVTKTSKDTSTTAGIAGITQASPDRRILSKYEIGGSSTSELAGAGNTSRGGKLKATISARVVDVSENGNLVIEGRRQLRINEEDQYIVITGTVRPEDIAADNIVSSQYIADARVIYTGTGVINDKMRPGWMTRILDWVWPF